MLLMQKGKTKKKNQQAETPEASKNAHFLPRK